MRNTFATLASLLALTGAGFAYTSADRPAVDRRIQIVSIASGAVTLHFQPVDLRSETIYRGGSQFSSLTLSDEATTITPGRPVLPAISRFVVVSSDANLELVVSAGEPRRVKADQPPLPYEPKQNLATPINDDDGVFPPVLAEMGAPIIIRGVRLVKVTVYPVRYDSNSNEYLQYESVDVEVHSAPGIAINPVTSPPIHGYSPDFLTFMDNFAVNGGEVRRDDPDRDRLPANVGKYLIVTNANCLQYIIPFIEFRRKAGYQVDILSIPANRGTDTSFIQQEIQSRWNADRQAGIDPFEYLLLVGDLPTYDNFGPAVGAILAAPSGVSEWNTPPHADHRYACLEGDDDNPDAAFGRWPGGSAATLGLIVGRQLAMSADPQLDHPEYYDRAAVASQHWGGGDMTNWNISIATSARWAKQVMQQHFADVRFYEDLQWDQEGAQIHGFIRDQLNAPVNVELGRVENYSYNRGHEGDFDREINPNTFFPTNLNLGDCGGNGPTASCSVPATQTISKAIWPPPSAGVTSPPRRKTGCGWSWSKLWSSWTCRSAGAGLTP